MVSRHKTIKCSSITPQSLLHARSPENNQIHLNHSPMFSHHKTNKSSSITPLFSCATQQATPCSRNTKQSNPAQSLPYSPAPLNNQIQLNHSPIPSHHKITKQSNPAQSLAHARARQNSEIQLTPPCSRTTKQSNPCSRTTKQSNPAQALPDVLTPQNKQIPAPSVLYSPAPLNNQIQLNHSPIPSHHKIIKQSNPAQSLAHALAPQNNQIPPNHSPMLLHH